MPINQRDITIVIQGPVLQGTQSTAELIRLTRRSLPHSRYVVSTWKGADLSGLDVDDVVLSPDPGNLPAMKANGKSASNNLNRQILTTHHGLEQVYTPYAVKMRSDCALQHARFLDSFEAFAGDDACSRILATSLFTIDPHMFEQMPYHVSDWFHFARTEVLQQYWGAPFMTEADATHYDRHRHADHSTFLDRRFRSRLAPEQHLAVHHAARLGYPVPKYHNDLSAGVLQGHRNFLARHWVIFDPWDMGLWFPKYEWAYRSSFQRLNCLLFVDWYRLYMDDGGSLVMPIPPHLLKARRLQKRVSMWLGRWMDKAGPVLERPLFKQIVNRTLEVLAKPVITPALPP